MAKTVFSLDIDYRLAPFGRLPYGHEIWGELYFESSDGCSPFQLSKDLRESEFSIFMVLKSGNCNIKLKALNAERAGAHLAIISSATEETTNELLAGVYNLNNINTDIPTIVVLQAEVDTLKAKYLKSKEILMKFQMPIPRSDRVVLDFFIIPTDNKMYSFVRSFKTYAIKFEDNLDINFNFLKSNDQTDAELDKIIRMINCLAYAVLFDILGTFNEFCVQKGKITSGCLQDQIDAVENKYIAAARKCVQKNSHMPFLDMTEMHNAIQTKQSYIHINGKNFHGSMKAENLFEAVCGGFTHAPEYCVYINNRYTPNTHYHDIKFNVKRDRILTILINIIFALVLLTMVGISLYLIYEKLYKQLLEVKTSEIVKQSVIDYQSLKNND